MSSQSRIRELYRIGGVSEIARGVRDTALIELDLPLHKLPWNATIEAAGVSVAIRTDTRENYLRAGTEGEAAIQETFVDAVRPGDVVWDVGANIGTYALLAAQAGAEVVAFEPGPRARGDLVANAQLNDLDDAVNSTPYALSDYDGEGMLLPSGMTGTRELRPEADTGDAVPVRSGDGLSVATPDVLKVDVEGHELHVLRGMTEALEGVRFAVVETHSGVDPADVRELLEEAGLDTDIITQSTRDHVYVRGVDR